ncbi:hypothetical protein [Dysosmobacter sp. Sow4_B12]|uniref:hypothetical protein n=1 Tax=Dysosmobacter sp. Sow4_B12 TaxID=3438777 RepID=UPI003F931D4E
MGKTQGAQVKCRGKPGDLPGAPAKNRDAFEQNGKNTGKLPEFFCISAFFVCSIIANPKDRRYYAKRTKKEKGHT